MHDHCCALCATCEALGLPAGSVICPQTQQVETLWYVMMVLGCLPGGEQMSAVWLIGASDKHCLFDQRVLQLQHSIKAVGLA